MKNKKILNYVTHRFFESVTVLLMLIHGTKAVAQNIYTVYNSGVPGGGLENNEWVAVDAQCNLYMSQQQSGQILKKDAVSGAVTVFAGTGSWACTGNGAAATAAAIGTPRGMCFDNAGNLYFCDNYNMVIRKITPAGIISAVAGTAGYPPGYSGDSYPATDFGVQLNHPNAIAYDAAANCLIFSDSYNFALRSIDLTTGIINTFAGGHGPGYGGDGYVATTATVKMGYPSGVACDRLGNVYVADLDNSVVRKINTSNIISTYAGNGTPGFSGDLGAATSAELGGGAIDMGLATDATGNLYIGDNGNNVVRIVYATGSMAGDINTVAGNTVFGSFGDGGLATSAELASPVGVAVNSGGQLYVSDDIGPFSYNTCVREVCTTGPPTVTTTVSPCVTSTATYTATLINACGATYTWYKIIHIGHYSIDLVVQSGPSNTYVNTSPVNGDQIYCVVTVSSYTDACNSGSYTSNVVTLIIDAAPPVITDIDINTRCAPGIVPGLDPQYTVTATGGTPFTTGSPYNYLWAPIDLISTISGLTIDLDPTLNSYTIADPTIIGLSYFHGAHNLNANYYLTVTDAAGCQASMLVQNTLITSGYDLASRDSHFDLYDEPNNQTVNPANWGVWSSPDIWNRYHNDGITYQTNQSPDFLTTSTAPNYLFVKVRNVGCEEYTNTTSPAGTLNTYWTMGGGGEAWPDYWTGTPESPFCSGSSGTVVEGNYANATSSPGPSATLPSIPAGSYKILSTAWYPPNPSFWYPALCYPTEPIMELCFLSRIVDYHGIGLSTTCAPDYMTYCEVPNTDITSNVVNNNNIATLNTSIATVNALPAAPRPHIIVVGSGEAGAQPFSLQFVNNYSLSPSSGSSTLSQYVNVKVYLGQLFNIWLKGGGNGTYLSMNQNEQSVTFDGSNTMRLDNIILNSRTTYPVAIEFDMLQGVDGNQIPNETVNFRQLYFGNPPDTTIDSTTVVTIDSSYDASGNVVYDTVYSEVYDTTYTNDTVYSNFAFQVQYMPPPPPCPGVLTVTQMSNGPAPASPPSPASPASAAPAPQSGCNYGQLTVANCGQCNSSTVNVQGWIIDDNASNFNIDGCTITAGITQSHYRLSYDSIWASVPVGSNIIVYNVDSNCYNLPDSFTINTGAGSNPSQGIVSLGNTYWVPLGGTEAQPYGLPHVERFKLNVDSPICSVTVDTFTDSTNDSLYYEIACEWDSTINFDTTNDAFQVFCPRCGRDMQHPLMFYHGFGYGLNSGADQYVPIPASSESLGGAVLFNSGSGYKYCFVGSSASDLGNPSAWQAFTADPAGVPPATLGYVNSAFGQNITQNQLNLPCCSSNWHDHHNDRNTAGGGSNGNNTATTMHQSTAGIQTLNVYPIPATMMLNFQYTAQQNITIKLFDVTGRIVDQQVLQNSSTATFDVSTYTPGIYMYQVITNTNTQSGKVLIGK